MALVHLRNDSIWYVSRWALRELLALVAAEMPDDEEALYSLRLAEAVSALQLELYEPAVAERIEKALLRVARAVAENRMPARPSDVLQDRASWDMFAEGVRELLKMMVVPVEGGGGAS